MTLNIPTLYILMVIR